VNVAASGVRGAGDRGLLTTIGGCGLGAVVLTFVPAVANSGNEPSFNGSAGAVVAYLRATSTPIAQLGSAVMTLGIVALLVFLTTVAVLLHSAGTELSWRPAVVAACAAAFGGIVLTSSTQAAARQASDVSPGLARFAFDQGNLSFANAWVVLGVAAVCSGWEAARTRALPTWLAWWAIVAGAGLALVRLDWTAPLWFLPYSAFWLWVVAVSVVALLRARRMTTNRRTAER
jgi:hypothetical protein